MASELCRVTTEDGLQLEGCYSRPNAPSANSRVDALMLVHGTGSNFYAAGVLEVLGSKALESGLAVLRINTRGHDGLCSIPASKGSVKGGAVYENLGDCVFDIAAWVAYLESRGHNRIGLVGHSSGAVKVLYTLAHRQLPSIAAFIGISPPRFNHELLRRHPDFVREFEQAEALVNSGRGDTLQQMSQPLPLLIAASRIVTKYGTTNNYDFVQVLNKVQVPTLILLGAKTVETSIAFQGLPEAIRAMQSPHVELQVVEGANIHYSGQMDVPWNLASEWLKSK